MESPTGRSQRDKLRLQKLCLYGNGIEDGRVVFSPVDRLLEWLSSSAYALPRLTSVELSFRCKPLMQHQLDGAFSLFATLPGLQRFCLGLGCGTVSRSAIEQTLSLMRGCVPDSDVVGRAATSNHDDRHAEPARLQRRPFAALEHLEICIDSESASALARLLPPSLLRLDITDSNGEFEDEGEEEAERFLTPFTEITQLRELRVGLAYDAYVWPSTLHALRRLRQLRVLELQGRAFKGRFGAADLRQVLLPMSHLRRLAICFDLGPGMSGQLLRVVGEACPQLGQLEVMDLVALGEQVSERATHMPLLPQLEYLGVDGLWNRRHLGCVTKSPTAAPKLRVLIHNWSLSGEEEVIAAESDATLLLVHAPLLKLVACASFQQGYQAHVQHVLEEQAQTAGRSIVARCGRNAEWASICDLCGHDNVPVIDIRELWAEHF